MCALELQDGSELTTRVLAERVMHARDLDATDATFRDDILAGEQFSKLYEADVLE